MIYRQGDVLLISAESLPSDAMRAEIDAGRIILAYGEVTGHAHAIRVDEGSAKAILWDAAAERFLQVVEESTLTHEEHTEIMLPPGLYRVVIQSEYTPQEIRNVSD